MIDSYLPYFCSSREEAEKQQHSAEHLRATDLCRVIESYLSLDDAHRVYDAFLFAAAAHDGVTRKSGEAYIFHPLTVAYILAEMHMDADTVCAALLHDVIEDTAYTKTEIIKHFGQVTADLVDGVTKLSGGEFTDRESAAAASFHKMMTAMTQDFRVVLIKLADRQHNIKTLGSMPLHKQRRIARETLNIHAPLARRMGMNAMRKDLQLTAFKHLYPWRYHVLQSMMDAYRKAQQRCHKKIQKKIIKSLRKQGIKAELPLWEKNLYRLYQRIKNRKGRKVIDQHTEAFEVRILVDSRLDCYCALGVIHSLYRPKVGTFSDFIAIPKVYGFQAIETKVTTKKHQLIRILIQSRQMHYIAQYGIAAHWRFPKMARQYQGLQKHLDRWLTQVADIQKTEGTAAEFLEDIKADLFLNEIYISTPKGETKILPHSATPIDFAYAIHSEVGHHCIGAYIDDQRVSLSSRLFNGATVKVITDPNAHPQASWLNYVVSGKARSAIRYWLREEKSENFKAMGLKLLEKYFINESIEDIPEAQWQKTLAILSLKDKETLFSEIAKGNQSPKLVYCRLTQKKSDWIKTNPLLEKELMIKGTEGLAVQLQHCCHPIPGDTLVATLEQEKGLVVHRVACPTQGHSNDNSFSLIWSEDTKRDFLTPIKAFVNNHYGVLSSLTSLFNKMKVNIEDLTITGDQEVKEIHFLLHVKNTKRLREIINGLEHLSDVIKVTRAF
ncbi:MAG: bifunctional (p)ppGpp synthetase/guanosine-3',5'-bis(diphosphate) 3'-pyrophosphohydrolase [Cocleimonas sp.]|nr:bifunctional (p)ppGpp synthetase/guanosine-3',5'-bis(diphosphate) 3'-pyrophosphohydrolase [Cocleimonas sp.]